MRLLGACIVLSSCAGGANDSADSCANAPISTWETFGSAFMTENCQTCHASTQTDREGAPIETHFDTAADVWAYKDLVLARAAADVPDMPPLGGTTDDDRYLLTVWLTCGVEGE